MSGHVISQKIRNSAKGQTCTLQFMGICNHNPETTVLAHIRDSFKGMGNKASDLSAVYACSSCHDYLDVQHGRKPVMSNEALLNYVLGGLQRTHASMVERSVFIVPQDAPKPRKVKPRKPKEQRAKLKGRGFKRPTPNVRDIYEDVR